MGIAAGARGGGGGGAMTAGVGTAACGADEELTVGGASGDGSESRGGVATIGGTLTTGATTAAGTATGGVVSVTAALPNTPEVRGVIDVDSGGGGVVSDAFCACGCIAFTHENGVAPCTERKELGLSSGL